MIAVAIIAAKLADIEERLAMVRKHRLAGASAYTSSPEARDLVAFNLMLAVQSAADLASHVISDERLPPPRTVAEGFERIARHGVIPEDLAVRLQRAVGFRNVVAHGYTRMNLDALHAGATHGAEDLEQFVVALSRWVEERGGEAP